MYLGIHYTYRIIHNTYTLYIYIIHIHYTYTLYIYIIHIHYTYKLYIYIIHIHYTYTLYIYIIHIHYTYTLYIYIVHMYYTYTLYIYIVHIHYTYRGNHDVGNHQFSWHNRKSGSNPNQQSCKGCFRICGQLNEICRLRSWRKEKERGGLLIWSD